MRKISAGRNKISTSHHKNLNLWSWKSRLVIMKISTVHIKMLSCHSTRFFYKQHFHKQHQVEIGKKLSKS